MLGKETVNRLIGLKIGNKSKLINNKLIKMGQVLLLVQQMDSINLNLNGKNSITKRFRMVLTVASTLGIKNQQRKKKVFGIRGKEKLQKDFL